MINRVITERLKVTENPDEPNYKLSKIKGWPVVINREQSPDIVGVERRGSTWRNIDTKCHTLRSSIVKQCPCLTGIHNVTVDGQAMVEIPKFYFLHQRVSGEDCDRWWVSSNPFSINGVGTARVHKGFVRNGVVKSAFQVGAYEASVDSSDSTKAASVAGGSSWVGIRHSNARTYCRNRGNGFDMVNMWQNFAIRILRRIDAYKTWISSQWSWRGWGVNTSRWEFATGFDIQESIYKIWSDTGNETWNTISDPIPISSLSGSETSKKINDYSLSYLDDGAFIPISISDNSSSYTDFLFDERVINTNCSIGTYGLAIKLVILPYFYGYSNVTFRLARSV